MAASSLHAAVPQLELSPNVAPSSLKDYPAPDAYELDTVKMLKKGNVVLLKNGDKPCKLVDIQKSKTGKHGVSKYHVRGVHVLTGKKIDDLFFTGDSVLVPEQKKDQYHVLNCSEDGGLVLQSVTHTNQTREDLTVDLSSGEDEIANAISELYWEGESVIVTVYSVLGYEVVVAVAVAKASLGSIGA
jgi:translation initiation factor 5A